MKKNKTQDEKSSVKYNFILPSDSAEFLKEFLEETKEKNEYMPEKINPYLAHNRFYLKKTTEKVVKEGTKSRIEEESLLFDKLQKGPIPERSLCNGELKGILDFLNERNAEILHFFAKENKYHFKPNGKVICGVGGNSPYSNIQMVAMHHIYGIPYIPASAIKGALRNCWITEKFEGNEQRALENREFQELLGAAEGEGPVKEGKLVFFDTFPQKFTLAVDVQTPHFSEYYNAGKFPPTDDQRPIPVFFTCIQDAVFDIHIAFREEEIWTQYHADIDEMMKRVFMWYGIGAKTALGYGME